MAHSNDQSSQLEDYVPGVPNDKSNGSLQGSSLSGTVYASRVVFKVCDARNRGYVIGETSDPLAMASGRRRETPATGSGTGRVATMASN